MLISAAKNAEATRRDATMSSTGEVRGGKSGEQQRNAQAADNMTNSQAKQAEKTRRDAQGSNNSNVRL